MTAQPLEPRTARLEGAYEQVDKGLDSMDRRLDSLDRKIGEVRDDIGRVGWRMMSLTVGTWITIMLAILLHKS
ncbi:MAG TPA: hypothetical protein VGG22_06580 [Candidatus Baltobacteraceae bacterium]|jgi:hypothetical protein